MLCIIDFLYVHNTTVIVLLYYILYYMQKNVVITLVTKESDKDTVIKFLISYIIGNSKECYYYWHV